MAEQGADLFFQAALQYGYRYVFGNPGTTEVPFMDALARYPDLNFILCLQENVATGAADGFARMSGWPALVNLHLAPGLSNGLANMHNAWKAHVPMVVTVGEHDTHHMIEDSPLAGNIEEIARAICKWTWTVKEPCELANALHRATMIAMMPPQGPVCLVLPTNILAQPPLTPTGATASIPALHLPTLGAASSQDIERAVEALLAARHPFIVVGDVCAQDHVYIQEIAQRCHAQILYNTFLKRFDGPFAPGALSLPYLPGQRRKLLAQADALLLVGTGGFTTYFFYDYDPAPVLSPHTQVIHLDNDLQALGKNERASLPLYGDITASLQLLTAALRERLPQNETGEIQQHSPNRTAEPPATDRLTPRLFMQTLHDILPKDTILVDEAVTIREAMMAELLAPGDRIGSYITNRGGSLGFALPFSIGAALGAPQRSVLAVVGDGASMYTIQALWTMAHYNLPIMAIISNNAVYNIIKAEILRRGGTLAQQGPTALEPVVGLNEPRIDFRTLATSMGVSGWSVRNIDELKSTLQQASAVWQHGKPVLLDVYF